MEISEIKERFSKGLSAFLTSDEIYLLKNDVNERAITHKLAEHLQAHFPDSKVDCEYNRNGGKPKYIHFAFNESLKSQVKKIADRANALLEKVALPENEYTDLEARFEPFSTFPDIIVHKRGHNFPTNLLVIEVKKAKSDENDIDFDIAKLQAFTSSRDQDALNEYHFLLGIHLTLHCGKDAITSPVMRYFADRVECL